MRKKEKEITDKKQIEKIIFNANICRLGLCSDKIPYIVPMVFGYKNNNLYFHTGKRGKKIDILNKNNNVCFEIEENIRINKAEKPCDWSIKYRSVIGKGKAYIIDDEIEKKEALDIIMKHYSKEEKFEYSNETLDKTFIIKVEIEDMSGKKSK